jgi:hypothetical protein
MPPVRPIKNVTPPRPGRARLAALIVLSLVVVLLCVLFPQVLAFTELAARELRYFWWLVLLVALGAYFFFFFGRKKD